MALRDAASGGLAIEFYGPVCIDIQVGKRLDTPDIWLHDVGDRFEPVTETGERRKRVSTSGQTERREGRNVRRKESQSGALDGVWNPL